MPGVKVPLPGVQILVIVVQVLAAGVKIPLPGFQVLVIVVQILVPGVKVPGLQGLLFWSRCKCTCTRSSGSGARFSGSCFHGEKVPGVHIVTIKKFQFPVTILDKW